jgi:hypothetical protein
MARGYNDIPEKITHRNWKENKEPSRLPGVVYPQLLGLYLIHSPCLINIYQNKLKPCLKDINLLYGPLC